MCHHHVPSDRTRAADLTDESDEEPDDDLIEPFEEEPAEDVELLTDGRGEE